MIIVLKRKNIIFVLSAVILFVAANISVYAFTSAGNQNSATVVIDAGHGGADGGCEAADRTKEAAINLCIAQHLKAFFEENGYNVVMTREGAASPLKGKFVKRDDMRLRRKIRDSANADLFISIHSNTFSNPKYYGAQVVYNPSNNECSKLAASVQSALKTYINSENNRVPMASKEIYMLNDYDKASILVECGFLSNPKELENLKDNEYCKKVAEAIFKGCCEFSSGATSDMITTELERK